MAGNKAGRQRLVALSGGLRPQGRVGSRAGEEGLLAGMGSTLPRLPGPHIAAHQGALSPSLAALQVSRPRALASQCCPRGLCPQLCLQHPLWVLGTSGLVLSPACRMPVWPGENPASPFCSRVGPHCMQEVRVWEKLGLPSEPTHPCTHSPLQ